MNQSRKLLFILKCIGIDTVTVILVLYYLVLD